MRYGLAWRALRHRSGQALVLGLLAGIVVAACASGPLYERAVEQASLRTTLEHAQVSVRGLTVNTDTLPDATAYDAALGRAARLFGAPQYGAELSMSFMSNGRHLLAPLVTRSGMCAHLRLAAGRCAVAPGEIMVSDRLGRAAGLRVGDAYPVVPESGDSGFEYSKRDYSHLRVVGWYVPPSAADIASDYWFDRAHYWPGVTIDSPNGAQAGASDALFALPRTVHDVLVRAARVRGISQVQFFDAPLAVRHVGLDDLPLLRRTLDRLQAEAAGQQNQVGPQSAMTVLTGLPGLLSAIDRDRHVARSVVPLLASQLALAALIVFAVAVLSAAEQRRPELALARLRGGTRVRAVRVFTAEIGLLVAAGLVVGLAAAWIVAQLACRHWLVRGVQPELRWPVLVAGLGSAALAVIVVGAVALRSTAQPIGAMLRQVPPRRSRLGVSALEAVVGALALAGVVVIGSGSRDNPVAVLTPSLIGLLAGLAAGQLLVRVTPSLGRRALWRGRLDRAMAAFQLARRPGARLAVTLLCLASALVVFAVDAWTVSARNRAARTALDTGAAVVLHVDASSAGQLQDAVRSTDPSGTYATPVIVQQPPGVDSEPVVAVEPRSFARIAQWGWSDLRPSQTKLAALSRATAPPILIKGTTLQLRMGQIRITNDGPADDAEDGPLQPMWLRVSLRRGDGSIISTDLGPLKFGPATTLSGFVSCAAGCSLTRLGIVRSPADPNMVEIDATVTSMAAGAPGALTPVDLRGARDWASITPVGNTPEEPASMDVEHVGTGLQLDTITSNAGALAQHLDIPVALPALIAGPAPDTRDALGHITANNVDGQSAAFTSIGQLPLSPRLGAQAMIVDLSLASRTAGPIASAVSAGETDPMVWLARNDSGRERALVAGLAKHGVRVTSRETSSSRLAQVSASAPAWSIQLAIITDIIAALTAAGLLVMGVVATRRSRRDDFSALRIVGAPRSELRRGAVIEQLVVVLSSVIIGAAMGVVGAHLAMPSIPIFVDSQPVPPIRLPIAWPPVLIATGVLVVGLGLTAALAALRLTRSAGGGRWSEGRA